MAIDRINDSQAWNSFLKATAAARARTAGFEAVSAARTNQADTAPAFTAPLGKSMGVNYAASKAESTPARILGTRFDSYA